MKPGEAARLVADMLDPVLGRSGFDPVPRATSSSWRYPVSDGVSLFFSTQVDSKATDPYSGGGFRIEVEKSAHRRPAQGLSGRALYFQLLTRPELTTLLDLQNRVIASLMRPPMRHVELYPAGAVRDMYLSYFVPQSRFDVVRCWLRYTEPSHLTAWIDALAPLVPALRDRGVELLRSDERHLGQGSLL